MVIAIPLLGGWNLLQLDANAALSAPLMKRVRSSAEVRRECPVMLRLDDGTIVEGVADLVFLEEENGRTLWNVGDFKTDVDIAPRLAEYRAQLALYASGIERATGINARGAIFWI